MYLSCSIRSKTNTNCDSLEHTLPSFTSAACLSNDWLTKILYTLFVPFVTGKEMISLVLDLQHSSALSSVKEHTKPLSHYLLLFLKAKNG